MGLLAAGFLAAGLVSAVGQTGAAGFTGRASAAAATSSDLRVGTFNVLSVSADATAGDKQPWTVRRVAVISQILRNRLGVVGLQEANASTIYGARLVDGSNQYLDLLNGLNRAGGHYALTSTDRAVSGDSRIAYDVGLYTLVRQGGYTYAARTAGKAPRYLAWAVLRDKTTGMSFLFTTTHLDPYDRVIRVQQWREMIAQVNALKGALPVVITGDFNTTKYSEWGAPMLQAMADNGYPDTIGQRYHTNPSPLRPLSTARIWVNSFNDFRRDVKSFSYYTTRLSPTPKTGNGIDWIFASDSLTVRGVEVVVNMTSAMQLSGTIPSDHNLLRATIILN